MMADTPTALPPKPTRRTTKLQVWFCMVTALAMLCFAGRAITLGHDGTAISTMITMGVLLLLAATGLYQVVGWANLNSLLKAKQGEG